MNEKPTNLIKKTIRRITIEFRKVYNEHYLYPKVVKKKQKIFCIGQNKTGTTSLKKTFHDLGFIVGDERKAAKLLPYYRNKDFAKIISYCKTAQVFQDFPFSYPETYKYLDEAFPGSKFILSVRESPEVWYDSLIKFHSKMFGNGKLPTKKDLQNATTVWKGWPWEVSRLKYDTPADDPFNKEILIKKYISYNQSVRDYFKNRKDDLIEIDIAEKENYDKLMKFLNIKSPFSNFPWENKTKERKVK